MRLEKVDWSRNDIYEYVELKALVTGKTVRNRPTAAQERASAQRPDMPRHPYLLRDRTGAAAAFAWLGLPQQERTDTAELWIGVHPRLRRFGVGEEMLHLMEAEVRHLGRTRLTSQFEYVDGGQDVAPRYADRHGFEVVQRMVRSFASPRDVAAAAGEPPLGFEVLVHEGDLDPALLEARAALNTALTAAMPQGTGAGHAQEWTAGRLQDWYHHVRKGGYTLVEGIALRDGTPVGYSNVIVQGLEPLAHQRDTFVLPEARGHGLGRTLKAAVARHVLRAHPTVETLGTMVDEDNAAMNAVNAACGYDRHGIVFVVEKDLAEAGR